MNNELETPSPSLQHWDVSSRPETHFTKDSWTWNPNFIYIKKKICFHFKHHDPIRWQFRICPDSYAGRTYAKLSPDWFIIVQENVKHIFKDLGYEFTDSLWNRPVRTTQTDSMIFSKRMMNNRKQKTHNASKKNQQIYTLLSIHKSQGYLIKDKIKLCSSECFI